LIYRTKVEVETAAEKMIDGHPSNLPVYRTARRNWMEPYETAVTVVGATVANSKLPYLGEAFTASAAWHTIRALHHLGAETPRLLLPIWGLNHQLGSLELESRLTREVPSTSSNLPTN